MEKEQLRILVVTQYFWPENMRINDLVEGFVAKGHSVTVLTGRPNYPDGQVFSNYKASPDSFSNYVGARVVRVPMFPRGKNSFFLALNYLSFFTSASSVGAFKLRNKDFDAIFVYAVSPIMAAIPALVIGRLKKSPVFVWVLDLWPETLKAVGVVKNQKILSLVGGLVSWIYNRADYILMQSVSFSENVKKYCTKDIPDERLVYFPSWAEDNFSQEVSTESSLLARDDRYFTIVFAGNIGESQDFPSILDAAESVENNTPVRWVIVGDGRMSDWVKQQVHIRSISNFILLGRHPLEEMPSLFAIADALLVSLKTNEVFEKTIPGKVQAYLAAGKPIIAMIDGEAARVIDQSGAGMACPSGDAKGLARVVNVMARMSKEKRADMGKAGKQFYLDNFSKGRLFDQLEALFMNATLRIHNDE